MPNAAGYTTCFIAMAAAAASAQGEVDFRQLDRDGDDRLTRSEWQAAGVDVAFDDIDTNRDGYLSSAEVKAAVQIQARDTAAASGDRRVLSPATASDVESQPRHVGMYDADGDGRVSREEAYKDGELEATFIVWDTDDDGYLDGEELAQGAARQRETFRAHDDNSDGRIDESEWTKSGAPADFDEADANGDGRVDTAEWNAGYPWGIDEFEDTAPTTYGASGRDNFDDNENKGRDE